MRCPKCQHELEKKGNFYYCPDCARELEVVKSPIKVNKNFFLERYFGYEDHINERNKKDLIARIEARASRRRGDRAV